MRKQLSMFVLLLYAVFPLVAQASAKEVRTQNNAIYVVDSIGSPDSLKFVNQLRSFVWDADILESESGGLDLLGKNEPGSLILAIGPQAFYDVLKSEAKSPILVVFTSRNQYNEIKKKHNLKYKKTTAIFADSDINDQLSLITGIYANRSISVGVLLSEVNPVYQSELERMARKYEMSIHFEFVSDNKDIHTSLNTLRAKGVETILALPDSNIFNKKTFMPIIFSTMRNNQSIIGFSDSLVKAGALASVYYLPKHLALETNSIVSTYFSNGFLPEERFSKNFNVAVNKSIARSLNLYKENPLELVERVKKNVNFKDKAFEFVFIDTGNNERIL